MSNYRKTPIHEIDDAEIQSLFCDLCDCFGLRREADKIVYPTLEALVASEDNQDKLQALTRDALSKGSILAKRLDKLTPNSSIHFLCSELVQASQNTKWKPSSSVLSIIKEWARLFAPGNAKMHKLTRRERE